MTLLCLDGPEAGLVCDDNVLTFPLGYIVRPAEWFEGLHYPATLVYETDDD
jgi:hypothetical protein